MQIVNVYTDDEEHRETIAVNHRQGRDFEKDWETELETAKKASEEWNVNDVFTGMERLGWQIVHIDTIEVAY